MMSPWLAIRGELPAGLLLSACLAACVPADDVAAGPSGPRRDSARARLAAEGHESTVGTGARCAECHAAPPLPAPPAESVVEVELSWTGSSWEGFPRRRTLFLAGGPVFEFEERVESLREPPYLRREVSARAGRRAEPASGAWLQPLLASGWFRLPGRALLDACEDTESLSITLRLADGTLREVVQTCWSAREAGDPHAGFAELAAGLQREAGQVAWEPLPR